MAVTLDQLKERIEIEASGCWLWQGRIASGGYGQVLRDGRHEGAHRVAWKLYCGPIPDGLLACHKCDVPRCVNPAHLFLGTQKDNMADAKRKGRRATGDRHPFRLKPELLPRGDAHWQRRRPGAYRGEKNPKANLTEADVLEIRKAADAGTALAALGRQYGITRGAVWGIKNRRSWQHV